MKDEVQKALLEVLKRWCPPAFDDERFEIRCMRALLNLNAYEADVALVLKGKQPIRNDYPFPAKP